MKRTVDALRDGTFDLLVLGGGITGAGVALDAGLRGLRVALIDKGDFASGTSSVSSKLIHGGLRYLEHAGFRLVYEALHERRLLLHNAPHLVRPLRFIIPFYQGTRVPSWKWRAGLTLYDLLAGSSNLRRSSPIHLRRLHHHFPNLRAAGLQGGAAYFDAQMNDARLCLEVVKTAALQGAHVSNYVEAIAFEKSAGAITGVRALDHVGGADFRIRARQVLNATGPWVDKVCRLAGDSPGPRLRPTKGVHVLGPDRGLNAAFLLLHPHDGRVFFVIPWLGKTLLGTTDSLCDDPPENLVVLPEEIDYLLAGHNHYFDPALERRDLLNSFVGLRPLIRARPGDPSALSREFQVFSSASGLLSIAGGKYTTYRRMAEIITNTIAKRLKCTRRGQTRCLRLDGASRGDWEQFARTETARLSGLDSLSPGAAGHLVQRYGVRAADVAAYLTNNSAGAAPVVAGEPDMEVEFTYQREHEMAIIPTDYLLRRTRLGLFHPELLKKPFGIQDRPGVKG
jgi:glycerol-3-phosphate dehydrogenase